jgi:hypothetical protein
MAIARTTLSDELWKLYSPGCMVEVLMSVGVMSVGEMTVGVMRRPHFLTLRWVKIVIGQVVFSILFFYDSSKVNNSTHPLVDYTRIGVECRGDTCFCVRNNL